MVDEAGAVTMGGWAGWANERLQNADVASDALKLLACEVSGFMRHGDRVVADDEDQDDDDMRKLRDYMHKKGREERAAFIEGCSGVDPQTRLASLEATIGRMRTALALMGYLADQDGSETKV